MSTVFFKYLVLIVVTSDNISSTFYNPSLLLNSNALEREREREREREESNCIISILIAVQQLVHTGSEIIRLM